jgi:hypothetical protein
MVNGRPVEGLLQASFTTSNCFSSDSYSLTLAMGPFPMGDITFWSMLSTGYIEVNQVSGFGQTLQTLTSGMIDTVYFNPIAKVVSIEGRDLSSSLIDSYRQQDFVNQTASEVVSAVALYHGLYPVVTPTTGSVGRYYGDGYTRLSLGQFSRLRSDWDLVVQLARENQFDVFVQDRSLFFQSSTSPDTIPVHLAFRDVRSLRIERSMSVASSTTARVQSWNSQNMTSYASGTSDGSGGVTEAPAATGTQPFLFTAANFTSEQVTDSAGRYTAELTRLATVLHVDMPWDLTLSPRTIILIDETDSSLDTIYKIENVERHYSTISGSGQIIRAVLN